MDYVDFCPPVGSSRDLLRWMVQFRGGRCLPGRGRRTPRYRVVLRNMSQTCREWETRRFESSETSLRRNIVPSAKSPADGLAVGVLRLASQSYVLHFKDPRGLLRHLPRPNKVGKFAPRGPNDPPPDGLQNKFVRHDIPLYLLDPPRTQPHCSFEVISRFGNWSALTTVIWR